MTIWLPAWLSSRLARWKLQHLRWFHGKKDAQGRWLYRVMPGVWTLDPPL